MRKIRTFIKVIVLSLLLLSNGIQSKAQTWDTLPYLTHGVNAIDFINYNDTLVIVGNFFVIPPLIPPFTGSKFVVGWDSLNYHLFSDNLSTWNGGGNVLGIYNKRLYIGGSFGQYTNPNEINKLAVWNGTEWEKFGNAVMGAGKIDQFKVYRDTLYIGGDFGININGIDDGFLVKWNDTSFYTFPSMQTHPTGIEVYNDVLYAGLYSCFSVGSGQYVCNLGKYSGQAWSNVYDKNGNLFQSCVNSMLTDTINNDLYIACISIYRYDGEFFHHIGGAGSQVNTHA
ncbi:MAG: hypothetical protein GX879_03365, partial [Bacteroidales bacterium]|nr:hypothetical protein [Bacteroidales bacterium]